MSRDFQVLLAQSARISADGDAPNSDSSLIAKMAREFFETSPPRRGDLRRIPEISDT